MQEVNVKRTDLIAKIQENRDRHANTFKAAQDGYLETVRHAFDGWDKKLNHGPNAPIETAIKAVAQVSTFHAPTSHLEEYDRALAMLDMSVDETITLQVNEFQQLVMDEWGWKREFIRSTSAYQGITA